jgi:hypothetical protein
MASKSLEMYYYRFFLKNFPTLILIVFVVLTIMALYLMTKRIKKSNICNLNCYTPDKFNVNKEFCLYMCDDKPLPILDT